MKKIALLFLLLSTPVLAIRHRLVVGSSGGGAPTGNASGDLAGTYPSPQVSSASLAGGFVVRFQETVVGSMTVVGNGFSVGGSTLVVANGGLTTSTHNIVNGSFSVNIGTFVVQNANVVVGTTLTVQGNAFSVGGTTFSVSPGLISAGTTVQIVAEGQMMSQQFQNTPLSVVGAPNGPLQVVLQNNSNGAAASIDLVLNTRLAGNTSNYTNLGQNGGLFTPGATYSAERSTDSYLYSSDYGLNFVAGLNGNANGGADQSIRMMTGGATGGNLQLVISTSGATWIGIGAVQSTFTAGGLFKPAYGIQAASGTFSAGLQVVGSTFSVGVSSFVVGGSSVGIRTALPFYALDVNADADIRGMAVVGGTFTVQGSSLSVGGSNLIVGPGGVSVSTLTIGVGGIVSTITASGTFQFGTNGSTPPASGNSIWVSSKTGNNQLYINQAGTWVPLSTGPINMSGGGAATVWTGTYTYFTTNINNSSGSSPWPGCISPSTMTFTAAAKPIRLGFNMQWSDTTANTGCAIGILMDGNSFGPYATSSGAGGYVGMNTYTQNSAVGGLGETTVTSFIYTTTFTVTAGAHSFCLGAGTTGGAGTCVLNCGNGVPCYIFAEEAH